MTTKTVTLQEIRQTGMYALARELGVVGMLRFLQQFEIGHGDYSTERHEWLDRPLLSELLEEMQERRRKDA